MYTERNKITEEQREIKTEKKQRKSLLFKRIKQLFTNREVKELLKRFMFQLIFTELSIMYLTKKRIFLLLELLKYKLV
jgi:hypothetical protein